MTLANLETLVVECISKLDLHLIDLVIKNEGKGKSVEIYVDAEQGITTKLCSEASRSVDGAIESSGILPGPYHLTVSSPGVSRSLKYLWQYKKHLGRALALKLRAEGGTREIAGKLESMDGTSVVVSVGKNGARESVRFDEIVEAYVKAPW